MPPASRLKILFISLSNIGDVIMTMPVMQALHQRYPDAQMHVLADTRSASLFEPVPYVSRILLKHKKAGWRGLWQLVRQLRQTRYACVVDLRTDGLTALLRADHIYSRYRAGKPNQGHAIERHWAVFPGNGSVKSLHGLYTGKTAANWAAQRLQSLGGKRILAIAPGANWPPKTWPAERFTALCQWLHEDFDRLLLLGTAADQPAAEYIAQHSPWPADNSCGDTNLLQSAALLQHVHGFIGNDSGLGHMAAAWHIPSLTVFGPGEPDRYRPWGKQAKVVCSPSGQLADLSANHVASVARSWLR